MEMNRCPSCGGKLTLNSGRNRWVCPYCDSEFQIENEKKSDDASVIDKNWFIYEWDYKELMDTADVDVMLSSFIRSLNKFDTAAELEKYIRKNLMGSEDVCAIGIKEEKMSKMKNILNGKLLPDERIILYADNGIFVHGKAGTVITNQRTLFVEKNFLGEVKHATLPFLLVGKSLGTPHFRLGDRSMNTLTVLGGSKELQGAVAALICMLSFEADPDRDNIRLVD